MKKTLFRKKSLDQVSSPEQLNQYISVISIKAWVILMAVLAVLAAGVYWSINGDITSTLNASGIIFPERGSSVITADSPGQITDVCERVGDYVNQGDVIAVVSQEALLDQIRQAVAQQQPDEVIERMRDEYYYKSMIISPYSGRIMSISNLFEYVNQGDTIASIVLQQEYVNDKEVITYVDLSAAQNIETGMDVQISPDFAPREEYGYMHGYVSSVGTYPVLKSDIQQRLGNYAFEYENMENDALIEVRITLLTDDTSKNRIRWSSSKGQELAISVGTTCDISIITSKFKLIDLIF